MCCSFTSSNVTGFGFNLSQDLGEWWQARQLHQVEPGLIQDPAPWFGFYRVQIQGGSTYTRMGCLLYCQNTLVKEETHGERRRRKMGNL